GALMTGWRGKLLKDWTFLDNFQAGTGYPLTLLTPTTVGATNVQVRGNFNGQDIYAGSGAAHLNFAAVAAPPDGQWGNAGRNSIRGPAQFTMKASMQRSFKLNDRFNLALTINATNPFNHPTFRGYNTLITVENLFGIVSNPQPMRSLSTQMRLTF